MERRQGMFQIEKSRNYAGYETDIHIKDIETQQEVSITYGATWDLYWTPYTYYEMKKTLVEETFDIPKSEPELYSLLEELYQDVKNAKVYDPEDDFDEKMREESVALNKACKQGEIYQRVFDEKNNTITWHSDDSYYASTNILKIQKVENGFHLVFSRPEEYEEPGVIPVMGDWSIPIRFRNSGGHQEPFNLVFMRMYNKAHTVLPIKQKETKTDREDEEFER